MVKGLMRQSVHPMDTTTPKAGQNIGTPDLDDDDSQRFTETSSDPSHDAMMAPMVTKLHSHGSSYDMNVSSSPASSPIQGRRGSNGPPDSMATNMHADAPLGHVGGSSGGAHVNRPKPGRRLTFADETGGVLAEISYSSRTHYSKQSGAGPLNGTGRSCCVIS